MVSWYQATSLETAVPLALKLSGSCLLEAESVDGKGFRIFMAVLAPFPSLEKSVESRSLPNSHSYNKQ